MEGLLSWGKSTSAGSPISGFMGVKQTFSTMNMHLMTAESESWLIADDIGQSQKGTGYLIVGVYTNEPRVLLRGNRSEMHRGALILNTHGSSHAKPDLLSGEYWNDRKMRGTITLKRVAGRVFSHYDLAVREFAESNLPES